MMDIIKDMADQYSRRVYMGRGYYEPQDVVEDVRRSVIDISSQRDKIKYITTILEKNNLEANKHKQVCTKKENCHAEKAYAHISYFLNQDLEELGIVTNENTFTLEEKTLLEKRIEELLTEISSLKAGQQVIYDDLLRELVEIKEYFYLGKKNWRQLLMGKVSEMVAGGVISETIGHSIVETVKPITKALL